MKIIQVTQGTTEWAMARMGIPTASNFDKIITPKTGKPSSQIGDYAHQLLAEQLLGRPLDDATSGFMQRGTILEKRAVSFYELQRDCTIERVGFITNDAGTAGCSPDGLVGDRGGAEIKVPAAHTHLGYLLGDAGEKYRCQVQGCMLITERDWWDFVSYNPDMPSTIVRFNRDEAFIKLLEAGLTQMHEYMANAKEKLQKQYGLFADAKRPDLRVVA